jgi:hypothetical protein
MPGIACFILAALLNNISEEIIVSERDISSLALEWLEERFYHLCFVKDMLKRNGVGPKWLGDLKSEIKASFFLGFTSAVVIPRNWSHDTL